MSELLGFVLVLCGALMTSWLMIVGLAFATVLTLVVVPCIFAVFVETFGMNPVADPREPAAA